MCEHLLFWVAYMITATLADTLVTNTASSDQLTIIIILRTHINMTYSHTWYMLNKGKILEKYRLKKQEDEKRKKEACHFEIIYGPYTVSFD
jgi:hypothetical protein